MKTFAIASLLALSLVAECSSGDQDVDGVTSEEGDCNDTDASIHPTAADVCGDGIDSNCDAVDPTCHLPVELASAGEWDPAQFSTVYEVGPGKSYPELEDVPWESLTPSTLVRIYPRDTPYRSKFVVNVAASEEEPVVIEGVIENGIRPIISGEDAITRPQLDYWNEERSLIKIGGSTLPNNPAGPSWIYLEDLDLQKAKPGYSFTDDAGRKGAYVDNAAAVLLEAGDHLTVRSCVLHEAGNGLFSASSTSAVLIQANSIFGNGNAQSQYEHNTYTESLGIIYEFNHFGPVCSTCSGNNLKDRSAGTIIRYNFIEDASRQIDMVESSSDTLLNDPSYFETFVYGNVLLEGSNSGNSQIMHYGGDGDTPENYRNGTLYLFGNTIVSHRSQSTTLVRISTDAGSADIRGNIVRASSGQNALAIIADAGTVWLEGNWLQSGWVETHEADSTAMITAVNNIEGTEPGFEDEETLNFELANDSACLDIGPAYAEDTAQYPLTYQYMLHQSGATRAFDGAPDLGGIERP